MYSKYELQNLISQRRRLHLSETPDALANQLLDLLGQRSRMLREPAADRLRLHHMEKAISRLQYSLAIDFGLSRGWTLTMADFSPAVLAGRKAHGGYLPNGSWSFADHTYWYRQGRRAAAVATHPYDVDESYRTEAARWAAGKGLSITDPTDFPSWWLPGRTAFVLFTPVHPLATC